MRLAFAFLIGALCVTEIGAHNQQDKKPAKRYGIEAEVENYPQVMPKDTLNSVIKAIEAQRIDYLLAHLTDPAFVDKRIKEAFNGKFDDLVKEATGKLTDDPTVLKELKRFRREGTWDEGNDSATVKLKDLPTRSVFLRKIEGRWFLENRQK